MEGACFVGREPVKLRIPRAGDQVLLTANPARPGGFLYAGNGVAP
ncbi:hypothetical protein [Streptomyces sp. YIM S03343]